MRDLTPDELTTLARYFAGHCSAAEAAAVAEWIAADPVRQAQVEGLRAQWAASGFLVDRARTDVLWRRLEARRRGLATRGRVAPVRRVAAAVGLAAGSAGLWWFVRERSAEPAPPVAAARETRTHTTPRGQRALFRLPDGTQVMLGPASAVRYAMAADRGPRTVSLEGTAYFTVTHDADRPFTVQTLHGVAKDLGTRFTVQAYPSDSVMDVVVAEGEVSLHAAPGASAAPHDSLVLAAGDRGRATGSGRMAAERGIAVDRYLAWTEGRLEFQDTPLADAVVQLGRWFDLDVRLADPALGRKQLTASFGDESASEVLRLIAASSGLRVEQQDNVVTIRGK